MAGVESERGPTRSEEGSRSAQKRRAIVSAASSLFLSNGYAGTSMDQIAAEAGVSKQTVYKQFDDKQKLFTEIVTGTIDDVGGPFFAEIENLEETDDLTADLSGLGHALIGIVKDRRLLRLRRLVIAEAQRFPDLGRAYYERAFGRTAQSLASRFQRLAERGLLDLEDAPLAAQHFIWLVLSIPMNQAMLAGLDSFDAAELRRYADEGVRVFLAAYAPHPDR